MNIQPINSYYQQNKTSFQSRIKSLNVINPISHYTDIYFRKVAKQSRTIIDPTLPSLEGKINVLKLNKGKSSEISAWDINPENSQRYVMFLHGMSQNVSNYQHLYDEILQKKVGVFAVEYRGYGANNSVQISEDKLRKDVERAYRFLTKNKDIKPENVTVIGHSMGGALATHFATKHKDIKSLVLISPLTNMSNIGKKFATNKNIGMGIPQKVREFTEKINPLMWLFNLRFNSLNKINKVETPTYIIQSQNDTVSLTGGARRLFKKAKRKGILQNFYLLPSGGHKVDNRKVNKVAEIIEDIYRK